MPERKVIALTGTMGAGKSTAARILRKSAPVLDLDQVNAHLLEPGQPSDTALDMDWIPRTGNGIDKKALAAILFQDAEKKRAVEAIVHPLIWQAMEDWIRSQTGTVFVEVPLLFETGAQDRFDEVWCITCSPETALMRLEQGRGISRKDALARLAHQWDAQKKAALSTRVFNNSGTEQALESALEKAFHD